MLDEDEIRAAVDVQQRSYRLLRWLTEAVDRGLVRTEHASQCSSEADIAGAWIAENFDNLPANGRPPGRTPEEIEPFACYFASYLITSFDLLDEPGVVFGSGCGCYCELCRRVISAGHLKTKKLVRADKRRAERLKLDFVEELALKEGLSCGADTVEALLTDEVLTRAAALATYGRELLHRCKGAWTGPEVLALWRQFAWSVRGTSIPGFELKAENILAAEARLREALHEHAV